MRRRRGRPLVIVLQPPWDNSRADAAHDISPKGRMTKGRTTSREGPCSPLVPLACTNRVRIATEPSPSNHSDLWRNERAPCGRTVEGPRGGQRSGAAGHSEWDRPQGFVWRSSQALTHHAAAPPGGVWLRRRAAQRGCGRIVAHHHHLCLRSRPAQELLPAAMKAGSWSLVALALHVPISTPRLPWAACEQPGASRAREA